MTLLGGLFLGSVAIIPAAVERATNVQTFQGLWATSLLILFGVGVMSLVTIFSLFSIKKNSSEESVLSDSDNKNKQEVKINEPV